MNILMVTSAAPAKSPFFTGEKRPPLGVGSIISTLRQKGHSVFFIDNYLRPSSFIQEGFLQNNGIDFVGVYTNTICYRDSAKMFSEMNELRKTGSWNGKIIAGGPHTSVALETIPDFVDHIVLGEGEKAISDVIENISGERIIRKERIKDLDSLPFQPWDIYAGMPYDFSCPWLDIQPIFTMNTSRGCPFQCSFCSVSSIWGRECTLFGAARIIEEIEYVITTFGAKGIYFREDNFTMNKKRIEEFCELILKKNLRFSWACESRADTLRDKNLLELMHRAGLSAVYIGVESGSQRILDMLNKKISVDDIEQSIRLCKKFNIRTYCSLIIGVPGEMPEDYLMTEKLMQKLKPFQHFYNIFVGIPKSRLYRYALENNFYEHIDDLGLVYPPGYNIKTKVFYGMESTQLIDHEFQMRTELDNFLISKPQNKYLRYGILGRLLNVFRASLKNILSGRKQGATR